jgi:CheY-like chemotaxis protein
LPAGPGLGVTERTILLAEDDRLLRRIAAELLHDEGYRAVCVEDAAEALGHLEAHDGVALLVTDVNMPGMNGLELAHVVRARFPAVRILVVSGRERIAPDALPPSAHFLQKPFSARNLLFTISRLLES